MLQEIDPIQDKSLPLGQKLDTIYPSILAGEGKGLVEVYKSDIFSIDTFQVPKLEVPIQTDPETIDRPERIVLQKKDEEEESDGDISEDIGEETTYMLQTRAQAKEERERAKAAQNGQYIAIPRRYIGPDRFPVPAAKDISSG